MASRLTPEIIDRIRDATDIVDFVSGYVHLERKGGNYFGLCPFHPEKTPSFSVHPGKGIFHCFGCGVGGNAFTFLQLHDKLSFAEAARELAQRCGIALPEASGEKPEKYDALYRVNEIAAQYFSRCLWEGKGEAFTKVRDYLKEREISEGLAKAFRLGYAPDSWDGLVKEAGKSTKGNVSLRDFVQAGLLQQKEQRTFDRFRCRLMFPILNLSGKVIAFGGRTLKPEDEGAKYLNSPETPIYHKSNVLYGLYQARDQIRLKGECLIVEGYMDLMRLHDNGFVHSVATSGTALTAEQAQALRRMCQKVILIYDGDIAGSHAAVRGSDVLLNTGLEVRVVGLPQGHDPDSFVRQKGAGAFGELLDQAQDPFSYRLELYRQEGRLLDIPSRTRVARELLESLRAVTDGLRQEMIARELAGKIGLSAETLLRELAALQAAARRRHSPGEANPPVSVTYLPLPPKQRNLLETLMRWPDLRSATFTEITAQEFQDGILRRLALRLESLWIEGRESNDQALITEDMPLEDTAFISQALSQMEAEAAPDVDRHAMRRHLDYRSAHDCLRGLLTERLHQTYQQQSRELENCTSPAERHKITKALKEIQDRQKILAKRIFWAIPVHPSMDFKLQEKTDAVKRSLTADKPF